MEETSTPFSGGGNSPTRKKRKVRKGTQSCWECKRRKIRCTFVTPTESVCDGCKSRQVRCVGQEFHYEVEAKPSKTERLDRVESLVELLAKRAGTAIPALQKPNVRDAAAGESGHGSENNVDIPPGSRGVQDSGVHSTLNLNIGSRSRFNNLSDTLLAAWPNQRELDIMTSVNVGTSVLFHGTVCKPYSNMLDHNIPSPKDIFHVPPPGSHPVLIARKLLMLGSYLQGIPPGAAVDLGGLDSDYRQVMSDVVETASRLVTTNDDLICSLEGIECIMIESMYHNNAGNLRRAWITNRRAMTIAQTLGLHLGGRSSTNFLEPETRDRIKPEYMWFRLVASDRYLSLILGLPQGSPEDLFATPEALESCDPLDQIERIETVVGGRILQRNSKDLRNLELTDELDQLLQDAAALMPAQWWLTPDLASLAGSDTRTFGETICIMNQFTYYHLLAQLHLPYMLQLSTDRRYDYSKITAVNASREILSRFVLFRRADTVAVYCRGADFLAFIASTTLCLAHIDSRRQRRVGTSDFSNVLQFLAHQRLSDRGLMERTLQSMEKMAEDNDAISCNIASFLQRLLAIEASITDDTSLKTSISSELSEQEFDCAVNSSDDDETLVIRIPYFGSIRIEHAGKSRPVGTENTSPYEGVDRSSERVESGPATWRPFKPHSPLLSEGQHLYESEKCSGEDDLFIPGLETGVDFNDWPLQGVDIALFDSFIRGSGDGTASGSRA